MSFALHRALARTLARLAPFYRSAIIEAAARAAADGRLREAADLLALLTPAEAARACAWALRIERRRNAGHFEEFTARCKSAVGWLVRLIARTVSGRRNGKH